MVNPHGGYALAPVMLVDPPVTESANDDLTPRDAFLTTSIGDAFNGVGTPRDSFVADNLCTSQDQPDPLD